MYVFFSEHNINEVEKETLGGNCIYGTPSISPCIAILDDKGLMERCAGGLIRIFRWPSCGLIYFFLLNTKFIPEYQRQEIFFKNWDQCEFEFLRLFHYLSCTSMVVMEDGMRLSTEWCTYLRYNIFILNKKSVQTNNYAVWKRFELYPESGGIFVFKYNLNDN